MKILVGDSASVSDVTGNSQVVYTTCEGAIIDTVELCWWSSLIGKDLMAGLRVYSSDISAAVERS